MAQPVWTTPAGTLGTYPQGIFLEPIPLQVYETTGATVYYKVIAGALPSGIECSSDGYLSGVPTNVVETAQEVTVNGANVTSKFTIRAYTTRTINNIQLTDRLMDRTFTLTIAGQGTPQWVTPGGTLGGFLMGTLLTTTVNGVLVQGLQLEYTGASHTGIPPAVSLVAGTLPPGITLTNTGFMSGFFELNPAVGAIPGFSVTGQGFDQYPFDFPAQAISYNYQFTLQVTDGKTSTLQTFSMFIQDPAVFQASTTEITSDDDVFDASVSNIQVPVILNPQGSIGSSPASTFFAYQFIGADIYNAQVGFVGYNIPLGLTLDTRSGWLYGYLPDIGLTERAYQFTVKCYKYGVTSAPLSQAYTYSLIVEGPISTQVTWVTPSDLGTIANGVISDLSVKATSTSNLPLQYRLLSGSNSKLPQGLVLMPSGNIVGRVSFNTFALDNGTTTFDIDTANPTTFDLTYTFTVNAYSINGYVSINQTFTIKLDRVYSVPFDNLYIKCMPPQDDRQLIQGLLQDPSIFPPSLLYRSDDSNFGLSKNVTYYHAYGLYPDSLDTYVAALQRNHYWKNLVLGPIQTAQALDPVTGAVIYEVVYSKIVDDLVNNDGEPVDPSVILAYPVLAGNSNNPGDNNISEVYPNALADMRDQVIDIVGQESNILPTWMLSKQTDGQVLGFTPAWVIAYTQPGASGQVAYNIENQFGTQLNLVDFKVDRYELDNSMAYNWNRNTQEWVPNPVESTTFDVDCHYNVTIANGGTGYAVGDHLQISGANLGGITPLNDINIVVDTVDNDGTIVSAFYTGTANRLTAGTTYSGLKAEGDTTRGGVWNVLAVPGVETVFDGGSIDFTDPANMNTNTDVYDKYLMFPRINILTPVNPYYVVWKTTNNRTTSWINIDLIPRTIPWTSSNA